MTPVPNTQNRWATRSFVFLLRAGVRHPSILWQFFLANARYNLIKRGRLSGAAKHVKDVRTAFEENAAKGQFKELFFDMADMNIVQWCDTFSKVFDRADPIDILEIGSWEGRSTLFLLTYFTQANLTAVDTWAGSDEYHYNATSDLRDLEARFDTNLAPCAPRMSKRKGSSLHVLPQLLDEGRQFDLIYVDGSHFADDVLTDGITAWRLLKEGGVLIFDDFLWPCYVRARANPHWPISVLLKYHAREYKVLNAHSQLIVQKRKSFVDHVTTELEGVQFGDSQG
ncbi:MAG: class I SAM-dependent methyltransferase [Mycobacteriaceae bacterium]|nr:class I SAM-dependent methyltransferase [Mycobacteriaceae bacterium]